MMRCPACGFVGFDHLPACKQCGKEFPKSRMQPGSIAPVRPVTRIDNQYTGSGIPGAARPEDDEPRASVIVEAEGGPGMEPSGFPAGEEAAAPGGGVAPAYRSTLRKAGFWLRALAFIVDLAVVTAAAAAGGLLVAGAVRAGGWFSSTPEVALEWLEGSARTVLSVLIDLCYFTLFVGWRGQTPGKMLLRLRIIQVSGGEVGYGRAFVRWIGQILSFLVLGIGFLMIAFSREKQGLHDKLAGTYVIRLST
jgi:uncharacterized RDD family membrane protein YckC